MSQTAAAALARCSPHTWKLFELNPAFVTDEKRQACEAALAELERRANDRDAA